MKVRKLEGKVFASEVLRSRFADLGCEMDDATHRHATLRERFLKWGK